MIPDHLIYSLSSSPVNTAGIELLSPFAPLFALLDFQNLYAWNKRPLSLNGNVLEDYTILVPIFNSPKFFKNKHYMEAIKNRVTLCVGITNPQMKAFANQMEKEGYTVFRFTGYTQSPWHVFRSSRHGATCSIERGTANRWNKIHDLPRRRLLSPERPRQSMRNDGRTGLWTRICNRKAIQDTLVDREATRCRIPACHDKQKIQTMADKWCLHNRQNGNPTQGHGEAYRILLWR